MITRDKDRNIVVSPDDIAALSGLIGYAKGKLEEDRDKIPGSLLPTFEVFIDAAKSWEKARES